MTQIQFGRCECDAPVEDELAMEFPDGETVQVVACARCGEAVEWDCSPERTADDRTARESPAGVVPEGARDTPSDAVPFSGRFAVQLALEDR